MRHAAPLLMVCLLLQGCAGAVMVGAVSGAMMANDERTVKTQIDDTNTDFRITSALLEQEDLKKTNQYHWCVRQWQCAYDRPSP